MPKVPGEIDRRSFLRAMARLGWRVVSVRGSHFKLAHAQRSNVLIVGLHGNVRRNVVLSTLREADIQVEEFLAVL